MAAAREFANTFKEEKIEGIHDLQYLNKYACQKIKYRKEWYIHCLDCAEFKKCRVGQQAAVIMENETKASKPEEDKQRQEIIDIFSSNDPVKTLLENAGNVKPQTVYLKVNTWRKKHEDLEKRFHMLEKVRFLWRKPYDSMRVPDILKELYPNDPTPTQEEKVYKSGITLKHEEPTQLAPNSKIVTIKPETDDDSISLEDFLKEADILDETETSEKPIKREEPVIMKEPAGQETSINALLENLKHEQEVYSQKLAEINKQIEAVLTVQNLMANKGLD